MRHVSTLITQRQQESGERMKSGIASASGSNSDQSAMPRGLTEKHITLLWERMAKIYGHKWTSSFGNIDDGTWLKGLWDVSPEQVAAGLEKCRTGKDEWPPTLPMFRAMCLPEKVPAIHRDYVALPKPPQDPDVAKKSLAEINAKLGRGHAES